MYLPVHFAERRPEVLHAAMRGHPLATLASTGREGLAADHLPLQLSVDASGGCRLLGHVARANPLWREAAGQEVLAIFHGPQAYVTPAWYPTKHEHGKAVPTWNYVVVHARGRLAIVEDPAVLRAMLDDLVERHEAARPEPWRVADAPSDYIDKMIAAIVGIEIAVTRIEGKWKASQNQPAANRAGIVAGLHREDGDQARSMAALVAASRPAD